MGFSRQESWSGLPCPPPGDLPNPKIEPRCPAFLADCLPSEPPGKPIYMLLLLLLLSRFSHVRPHRWKLTRLPGPWDSPGKNTGVGCHFLLQCMKVKSESEVAQSCPIPSDPMDCSPPGPSFHGIFQARVLEWGAIAFSDLYVTLCYTHIWVCVCVYTYIYIYIHRYIYNLYYNLKSWNTTHPNPGWFCLLYFTKVKMRLE